MKNQNNMTYGLSIPPRKEKFSVENAGKQHRLNGIYLPNMIPASFNPEILKNPHPDNTIFQHDPMTLQRAFMVSPCPEDDISSQMLSQQSNKYGIFSKNITAIPPNPLSKLGINMHDRVGKFGADFKQKPFYQASSY